MSLVFLKYSSGKWKIINSDWSTLIRVLNANYQLLVAQTYFYLWKLGFIVQSRRFIDLLILNDYLSIWGCSYYLLIILRNCNTVQHYSFFAHNGRNPRVFVLFVHFPSVKNSIIATRAKYSIISWPIDAFNSILVPL
jgi:hypothetical protein